MEKNIILLKKVERTRKNTKIRNNEEKIDKEREITRKKYKRRKQK